MQRPLSVRFRRLLDIALSPTELAHWLGRSSTPARARQYLEDVGVLALLRPGENRAIPPELPDLANLHRLVRRRRPNVVLEFGSGYSTVVIAHALSLNADDDRSRGGGTEPPRLWSVDANEHWLETTRKRVPPRLGRFVEFWHSPSHIHLMHGQLVSLFDRLPNIVPDFIYLDGPDPRQVQGDVHGLGFAIGDDGYRHPLAADVLLYESTLQSGFFLLLDNRYVNAHFLRANLKRRYRFRWNWSRRQPTFELLEWTGLTRTVRVRAPVVETGAPVPVRWRGAEEGAVKIET